MTVLFHRARTLWLLGYPDAALADARQAVRHAYEIEQAATLMYALNHASYIYVHCGDYYSTDAPLAELAQLTDEKGAALWKAYGLMSRRCAKIVDEQSL